MPVLLHLDSSPMGEQSISRQLTREFTRLWREAHPGGEVIYRDIIRTDIPVIDAEWVAANYTSSESRTAHQHRVLELSTELTQELLDADEYVFGLPLHNWGSTAGFKLWADQIVRFGRTMQITSSGMKGMLDGKRLTAFLTAGRRYGRGWEDPARNHLEPWLRTFFENLGIRDMRLIFIDGTGAVSRGKVDIRAFLEPHIRSLRPLFECALPS
jgi:FMN-dependent NADH-azoreductase